MAKKVLVCNPVADEAIEMLEEAGLEVDQEFGMSKEELTEKVPPYHALIVRSSTKVREPTIDAAENLEAIGRPGIGLDNIDVDYAEDKGISIFNTPTATSVSVAELAMTHILVAYRNIVKGTNTLRDEKWIKKDLKSNELYNKTLGLIGFGNIGQETGRRAKAFGMDILYHTRTRREEAEKEIDAEWVSLEELLERSDVISLHVPHTDQTHDLISKDEFELMKDDAVLVDCARGGVVNEEALFEALKEDKIRFASKDVFEQEPPGKNPLFDLDNFHATPHIGAQTYEGQTRAGTLAAEQVIEELERRG